MNICPICEHPLVGNVCVTCKKVIKNPWRISDGVYINRSHSLPDDFCEYHMHGRVSTLLNQASVKPL